MNVFSKVTLQGLKRNRTRTVVTIIGVILSAAMFTAVTSFISSLQSYLLRSEIARNGDWHAKFQDVDAAFIETLAADEEIKSAVPVQNVGYALLEGGRNQDKPYLFVLGFSDASYEVQPVTLVSGRLPQNSGEVVISEHIRDNGGVTYNIGDVLTLQVGSRIAVDGAKLGQDSSYSRGEDAGAPLEHFEPEATKTYTVVGICQRPNFEPYSAPGYTVTTTLDAGVGGHYDAFVKLKSASDIYRYTEQTAVKYTLHSDYLRFSGVSNDDTFNTVLYTLGGILIALIMIGSVLLIYNAFSISVSERTRQFGILSSVGATGKQLRRSVLFEGLCIGGIGIPLGILLGVGGIGVTLRLISGIFETMNAVGVPLTLSVSAGAVIVAGLVGIATILISAYIPARRAAALSAIDSIRQTGDIKIQARAVKTSKLTERLLGLEGLLARKNFKRSRKRYRATIVSLFVSVVLFVAASAIGLYLKQGTDLSIDVTSYDLRLTTSGLDEQEAISLYDKLRYAVDVYGGGYQFGIGYSLCEVSPDMFSDRYNDLGYGNYGSLLGSEETLMQDVTILFIDDDTYLRYLRDMGFPAGEYTGADAKLVGFARIQRYDYSSKRFISVDMFPSQDALSLGISSKSASDGGNGEQKNINVTLADKMPSVFTETYNSEFTLYIPCSMAEQFIPYTDYGDRLMIALLSKSPMQSAAEMQSILKETVMTAPYYIYNVAAIQESNRNTLLVVNVFTYGFIVLMALITVANVFNTISTGIGLRRREFAMLMSVGMTGRGFQKMMNYECVFYGVKALLYGLPASAAVSFLIYRGVAAGVDVPFTLPWSSIGISVFGVFLIVFVTMLYAIGKVKKENTVDVLKSDIL